MGRLGMAALLFPVSVVCAAAQDVGTAPLSQEAVDLDQRGAQELVLHYPDAGFTLVAWNPELRKWIEVFSGSGSFKIGNPAADIMGFSAIELDGVAWTWSGSHYVARIPDASIPALGDISVETLKVVAEFLSVDVPPSTGGISYADVDGSQVNYVILDQSMTTCVMDGLICSGVVVRNGVAERDIGATVGLGYRISDQLNASGRKLIEQVGPDGILSLDPDSGEVFASLAPKEVRISPYQPETPGKQETAE